MASRSGPLISDSWTCPAEGCGDTLVRSPLVTPERWARYVRRMQELHAMRHRLLAVAAGR